MREIAETFPPGEFLKEELEARGWTQTVLAEVMGRPVRLVNELILAKRTITAETAIQLGEALGTGAEIWMNLESQYQLSKLQQKDDAIVQRAALYERFPVREMIKRGWIQSSENVDVLAHRFLTYFRMETMNDVPRFAYAAKKTDATEPTTMQQLAWLLRARNLAIEQVSLKYDRSKLVATLAKLSALRTAPEETRHVPRILAECGMRYVVVEALPGSQIDGACFWLEGKQPVVAMSLRLDRIDNFWFVLRHEIEHVLQEHGQSAGYVLDSDIEGMNNATIANEEKVANDKAADFCVSQAELNEFISRVTPYFSEEKVLGFARRLQVHVGLVAGQLRRKLNRWDRWSGHLVKVRHIVTKTALVDGWGLVEHS